MIKLGPEICGEVTAKEGGERRREGTRREGIWEGECIDYASSGSDTSKQVGYFISVNP